MFFLSVSRIPAVQMKRPVPERGPKEREREGERDRQTDRQAGRQAGRDRQAETDRQTDRETDRQIETERQRQTEGDIQTDRQTDRQTENKSLLSLKSIRTKTVRQTRKLLLTSVSPAFRLRTVGLTLSYLPLLSILFCAHCVRMLQYLFKFHQKQCLRVLHPLFMNKLALKHNGSTTGFSLMLYVSISKLLLSIQLLSCDSLCLRLPGSYFS